MLDKSDPKLTAFVLEELDKADRAVVEAEIEQSAELQKTVAEIREATSAIANTLKSESPQALTDSQREKIGQQSKVAQPVAEERGSRRIAFVIAASLLITLGAGAIIFAVMAKNKERETVASRNDKTSDLDEFRLGDSYVGTRDMAGKDFSDMEPRSVAPYKAGGESFEFDVDDTTRLGETPSSGRPAPGSNLGTEIGGWRPTTGLSGRGGPSGTSAESAAGTPRPRIADPGDGRPTDPEPKVTDGLGADGTSPNHKPDRPRSWKRVKATPNTSRLMVGDRDELPMEGMQVNVVVDGFRARVILDCYFYNNRAQQLEGKFKLRLPDDASLYYFAFGETSFQYKPMVDQLASKGFLPAELVRASGTGPAEILEARNPTWGKVKVARIVPREKAVLAYSETVRRRVDPALVEWSGAGVFNARVFPLMPNKLHRIVVGYDVNLLPDGNDLVYRLNLPEQVEQRMVDLNVTALPGTTVEITPEVKPFTSAGRAYYHFKDPHNNTIEVRFKDPGTMMLTGNDKLTGDYFATRVTPDLPAGEDKAASTHAIFLVDTSLSSNPDKFNVWLKMLEATLDKNRDTIKEFAVLFFNIESHWWKPEFVKNTPENVKGVLNFCGTLSLEGATDLRQALAIAVRPEWLKDGELPFKGKPDMFLLSDGAVTWGELNLYLLAKSLDDGWGGTLFAYKTGLTGTAVGVLEHLSRETGGAVFSIVNEDDIADAATAHRKRPWQLLNATVTGGSDILIAGRIRS
ncbi:MAG: hypothetical protein IH991_17845, partial [Planctomycetes bacterium]|nr:hypothetical protein [Planctomycetota bacterium]